ncbi:MAG: hypothetical protein K9N23_11765 [Akkermansiaceae bacterium]|nr:hypothetical protein [Akkermansiaceae bacterium]
MSKPTKRTRTLASKTSANGITIRPYVDKQGYVSYLVQGWKENNKWQRRQFKERAEAETFASTKRVEMENKGRAQRMILSPMTQQQHDAALAAVDKLGGTYALTEAVEFFLRHHRAPDYTIRVSDALKVFIDEKERDGLRPRTLAALKRSLERFAEKIHDPFTHEVTHEAVAGYLRQLRTADGMAKASLKFWNNSRNELNGFFAWATEKDRATSRPFTFENPVAAVRAYSARQVREQQAAKPMTTTPAGVRRILGVIMRWRGGALVRYYALAYFAGIRPEEIQRMNGREKELINLKTRTITIPANISKTRQERQVMISNNLAQWLSRFPAPVIPTNFRRMNAKVRKHFAISHDEARHSFISYHVAVHRSVGDAALQAGNSEAIVKRHYLNLHPREEGAEFFRIVPGKRRAVLAAPETTAPQPHLKAI